MSNEIQVNVDLEIQRAVRDLKRLDDRFDTFEKSVKANMSGATSALSTFKGALGALGIAAAFKGGAMAVKSFAQTMITDGIAAAQVQEDAVNALNTALEATGKYSTEASTGLQDFASSLQQNSTFGDEAILNNMALIQSLADLDDKGLKRATQATADLAAGLQIDLRSAATLVGKGLAGEVGSFSRYGLSIKKGATEAETMANVLNALEGRFSGAAASKLQTFSGATQAAANSFGDFQEKIGFLVTQSPAVISLIGTFKTLFEQWGKTVEGNQGQIQKLIQGGLIWLMDALSMTMTIMDGVARFFKGAWQTLGLAVDWAIAGIITGINNLIGGPLRLMGMALEAVGKDNPFKGVTDSLTNLKDAAVDNMFETAGAIGDTFSEEGALGAAAETVDKFKENYIAGLNEMQTADLANLEAKKELDAQEKKRLDALLLIQEQHEKDKVAAKAKAEKIKKYVDEQALKDVMTISQEGMKFARGHNRQLFYLMKAAAIATATVQTAELVVKAYNEYGWPYGLIAGAAAAAAGGAQIAAISSQSFQFGGIVRGSQTGDNVPIRANGGEMILTREDQQGLLDQIRQGNTAGGGSVSIVVQGDILADDEDRVNTLIERITNAVRFNNANLVASGVA